MSVFQYRQGAQMIQREAILECVSSSRKAVVNRVLMRREAEAERDVGQPKHVLVSNTGRGRRASHTVYTVTCLYTSG
jgi:hypothetical protein